MKPFKFLRILFFILAILLLVFIDIFLFAKNNKKNQETIFNVDFQKLSPTSNNKETKESVAGGKFNSEFLKWGLINPEAIFAKRDAHTLNVFKNKLWIFGGVGGASPDYTKNYSDVWNSENGKDWVQITNKAPWGPRRAHDSVIFKDKIWILGGATTGERYLNDVWSSEDGINWVQVTEKAEWAPRKGFGAVVFDDKIWIMGGVSINSLENDVWYSENGKDWFLAVKHADWSPRYDLAVESFQNKLWLVGGVFPEEMGKKDVWVSENGKNWTSINEENIWPGRHGHCLLAFNDSLFIIGGWSGYAHGYNDVWYSKDGVIWNELYKDGLSLWIGREDLTCANFNNKIFMLGGMKTSGERTNDVWCLSKK
jgi:hypothetical protein